ncbi:hypothetical protein EVAR_12532_1 [Eumeta japonica]|uniref:Uncharacterized protein n=1 Tax=Eumeta variegata TaxID=151549 RepID=A0A4C1TPR8_EUMVA|nr:hypothetical protein EVAR_12532_1 [Eumeta japonica]
MIDNSLARSRSVAYGVLVCKRSGKSVGTQYEHSGRGTWETTIRRRDRFRRRLTIAHDKCTGIRRRTELGTRSDGYFENIVSTEFHTHPPLTLYMRPHNMDASGRMRQTRSPLAGKFPNKKVGPWGQMSNNLLPPR